MTIGDLIKTKDYDYVSYRLTLPDGDDTFAGCFSSKCGKIIPLDGDIYDENEEVLSYEEWSQPKDDIQNGLTVVVKGEWIREWISRSIWERRDYLNKEDFTLLRVDRKDGHEDYWYETSKAANEYLTDKYMEQSMKAVFRVVYSKDEDIVGIERTFPFNYDVIISEDDELKSILRVLSK